ncbi:MAG: zf-HC2 domain-containing protein [Acidimicrobiales bacterium]
MNCEQALEAISAAADGELADDALAELDEHLAGCSLCTGFERSVHRVRSQLRFEPVTGRPGTDGVPDVIPGLRAELVAAATGPTPANRRGDSGHRAEPEPMVVRGRPPSPLTRRRDPHRLGSERDADDAAGRTARRRRSQVRVAAVAAVVGMIVGATFVGLGRDSQPPAAADLAEQVLTAQHEIASVDARFRLTEGDERSFDGELTYEAPESLVLSLAETSATTEPADGDVRLEVDEGRWSLDAVRSCASCADSLTRWHQLVTGREPFSDAAPVPLELITAVDSFALTGPLPQLGTQAIAEREAIGVRVPAAQVADFLDALSPADDLRPVHPTDPVDVWLDQDYLVPLLVDVRAGHSPGRDQWAASHGYTDTAGASLLRYSVRTIAINAGPVAGRVSGNAPLPATERRDDAFRAGDTTVVPEPDSLPGGLRPHVSGNVDTADGPRVGIRSWTDGRAWVKVRATDEWVEPRLFGGAGLAVRPVDLGPVGVGYLSSDARTVALHTVDLDLVVTGSLPGAELRAVAASLGVVGIPIPQDWPEAAIATVADARAALPQVLVAHESDGFAAPAIRVASDVVTQVYAGPGDRGFVLTQSPLHKLSPPADQDSVSVSVRGSLGRYSVGRGELEWLSDDGSYSLASPTLSMSELVAVAERLGPP